MVSVVSFMVSFSFVACPADLRERALWQSPLATGGGLAATARAIGARCRRLRVKRPGEKVSVCESFSVCGALDAEWQRAKQAIAGLSPAGGRSPLVLAGRGLERLYGAAAWHSRICVRYARDPGVP